MWTISPSPNLWGRSYPLTGPCEGLTRALEERRERSSRDERSPAPPSVAHTFARNYDHIWVGEGRLGEYGGPGCSGFKRAVLAFDGGGENVGPPGGTAGPKRAQRMLWAS